MKQLILIAGLATGLLVSASHSAVAEFLTNVSFKRQVFAYSLTEPTVVRPNAGVFEGNGLAYGFFPHTSAQGGNMGVTYDFYDDPGSAGFNYLTIFSLPGSDTFVEQGIAERDNPQSYSAISFSVTEVMNYNFEATFDITAVGGTPVAGINVQLTQPGATVFLENVKGPFVHRTGQLFPGVAYSLLVSTTVAGFIPIAGSPPLSLDGSGSFQLQLIPIPEPSTYALGALGLVALLFWRRFRRS